MTPQKLRDEMDYRVCLSLLKTMHQKGLISAREMAKIDTNLRTKFHPYLSTLARSPRS